jgi:hypothetical protein
MNIYLAHRFLGIGARGIYFEKPQSAYHMPGIVMDVSINIERNHNLCPQDIIT